MKLIHLSDLHLGKKVNEFSMLEDQRHILTQILQIAQQEQPDAVLIAGDVYDKSVPAAEAVELFDEFLVDLAQQNLPVFIISGNHDSPERLAFGGRLMTPSGVHLAPVYHGGVEPLTLSDEYGPVRFWLLPFLKPAHVQRFFPDAGIRTYTDAIRTVVDEMHVNESERNVLIAHQFVTGGQRCDSEELSVGGSDNVDAAVFDPFDYVALGHLHGPQNIGSGRIRYCGSPLKYSFSEANHHKSVTVAELSGKGSLSVRTVPLTPLHDLTELRGTYEELTLRSAYSGTPYQEDYTHITLTDEEDIPEAFARLRVIYHRLMKLDYDNRRTRLQQQISDAPSAEKKSPLKLFAEFYRLRNGSDMTAEQTEWLRTVIEKVWGNEQ